ncbi:MAG TPA: hypothetical protein VEN81_05950, partial [Planctomycetota bacterium]|nr:hypothetical protein [Planctomycetota bacterium]
AAMVGFSFLNASLLDVLEGRIPAVAAMGVVAVLAVGFWAGLFGWVSRRFETEADLAAAKSTPAGARGMAEALREVAELNRISPWAWSWRHFSIAKRIDLLVRSELDPERGEEFERRCARWRARATGFLLLGLLAAAGVGLRQASHASERTGLFEAYERLDRGGELLQKDRFREARSELRAAIDGGAKDLGQAWLWLADCERALGDLEAARKDEQEARRRGLADPRERLRLAR